MRGGTAAAASPSDRLRKRSTRPARRRCHHGCRQKRQREDAYYFTSRNFSRGAPHTGHLSGGSPTKVSPHTGHTQILASARSWPGLEGLQRLGVEVVVDLLHGQGEAEGGQGGLVAFGLGLGHERRVHLAELVPLAGNGGLQVLGRAT